MMSFPTDKPYREMEAYRQGRAAADPEYAEKLRQEKEAAVQRDLAEQRRRHRQIERGRELGIWD